MFSERTKNLFHYVMPAVLTNACIFLFTIVDGIFVGQGVRSGVALCVFGSVAIVALAVLFSRPICAMFGASGEMLSYTVAHLPQYAWAFVVAGVNTLISAYFYSTKRSAHAIALNVARSLVVNTAVITLLPLLFGGQGWYQEEGKDAVEMKPGTVINISSGVKHWHGAAKDSWFSHLAIEIPGEETSTQWCEKVSDEEYGKL